MMFALLREDQPMTAVNDVAVGTIDIDTERKRLRRIARLKNPVTRCEQAHDIARQAQDIADRVRTERDQAATALKHIHGWKPVRVYNLIGLTRTLFHRALDRNLKRGIAEEYAQDEAHAEAVAGRSAGQVQRFDAFAEEARQVRDAAIVSLLTGAEGVTRRNADIAKMTGLTSARIAQLRPES